MNYELADAEDRADQLQRELTDALERISQLETENAELSDENADLRQKLTDLEARYDTLKNAAQDAHDNMTATLNTLDNHL